MPALPKLKLSAGYLFALIFLSLSFCCPPDLLAQDDVKIGQWRSHLPYQRAHYITQSETTLYFTTEWSIYSIDKASNEVSFLSKVEGLSDIGMSLIKYDPFNDQLIAIYANSNIDLITDQQITNLPFILTSDIVGDKQVYDVFIENETTTYLAMGFGLKVLNVRDQEFGDETKAGIRFNSVVVFNNAVYAGTDEGIYRFDRAVSNNIQDFGEWEWLGPEKGFPADYSSSTLSVFEGSLYTNINDTLFRYDGNSLDSLYHEPFFNIHYLSAEGQRLIVGLKCCMPNADCSCASSCTENCNGKALFMDATGAYLTSGADCINRARYALEDEKGRIWYADTWRNLRKADDYEDDCTNSLLRYNSPRTQAATALAIDDDAVWVATELHALDPKFAADGYYSFIDGSWRVYSNLNKGVLTDLLGFITLAINPTNNKVYIGTVWDGLVEMEDNEPVRLHNASNSTLRYSEDPNRIRVTGLAIDENDNLWVANHTAQQPISVLKSDGSWTNDLLNVPHKSLRYLVIDNAGYKWFAIDGGGQALLVYDDGGTVDDKNDDRFRTFSSGNSELPSNSIFSLAVDLDGDVWVGTNEGIVIFECGGNVFDDNCRGSRRILEVGGFNAYLLESEEVWAIAVDGANRKWVGTANGVFVLSASGEEQLAFFDTENSPLFDNQINAIAINHNNGEVFIGTGKGLISYRSDAVAGGTTNRIDAYAYPNPVRPDYDGPIAIKGLARDANVKITDINGQLVYETKALGGQAIWNGRDYNGRKASSGVYLVFSTNTRNLTTPDAIVTKILFLH